LQSKVFNKKTRGGRIQKVCSSLSLNLYASSSSSFRVFSFVLYLPLQQVREVYLRDDIYCGAFSCKSCDTSAARLSSPKIIVVDTNVVLHQVTLLSLYIYI